MVRCGTDERTHSDIRQRAGRLARALGEAGVGYGDRYAIVMRNEIGFLEPTLAGSAIGAIPVPVNWHWTGSELEHLLVDSGSKLAIVHSDFVATVEAAVPGLPIIEAAVPEAIREAYGLAEVALSGRYPTLEESIAGHAPVTGMPSDPPLGVIYTSGTTGLPKGILREPIPAEDFPLIAQATLAAFAADTSMSTAVTAPLYHTAPNTHAVIALALGMEIEILPRFDAEDFLRFVQERRVEHAQMVPTMFVRLMKLPAETRAKYDVSSLRSVVHAAAPCPPDVKRDMIEWWGPIVHEYYGGSETGVCVHCTSEEWMSHPGTVGRPLFDAGVKILDPYGDSLPVGESGDIYIKSFTGFPDFTYIGNDAKRRDMERDGYVTVGDVGYLDEDGFLYLNDRRNDMVISGGVNIYPAEIESCLLGIEGVVDAAVFGIPDAEYGEALAAHLQLEDGVNFTEEEIRDHVREHLAKYKAPRVVSFDEKLPRDEAGKLFKRRLKEKYWPAKA